MSYSIHIKDQFGYHARVIFGLNIQAPASEFPLLVGCSLLNPTGQEVDVPPRWLRSPGLAIWEVTPGVEFPGTKFIVDYDDRMMAGKIMFALWRNDTFTERLSDTGWVNWEAYWLIGSSTAGLDMQDERIKREYGSRFDVWSKEKQASNNDPLGIR
jgi:hypothetical protein